MHQKKFYDVGSASVTFPVLKDNTSLKLIVKDDGQLLANEVDNRVNFLLVVLVTRYPSTDPITIFLVLIPKWKQRGKERPTAALIITMHILSMCQNCKLCKNHFLIHRESKAEQKRALADNITIEDEDERTIPTDAIVA